jgi:predicted transcriptional regulator
MALNEPIKPSPEAAAETEAAVRAGILRGLADVEAGRLIPHDVAMRHLREVVARVRSESAASPRGGDRGTK